MVAVAAGVMTLAVVFWERRSLEVEGLRWPRLVVAIVVAAVAVR